MTAVAFITGGASGIGAAFGRALARRGVDVVLADRQLELAQGVADGIRQADGRASAVELDVRDPAQFENVVGDVAARHGCIDYLFNNAGIGVAGDIAGYTLPDWYDVFDVNLRGVVHGIRAVYPVMRAQGSGHIINTASMAGDRRPREGESGPGRSCGAWRRRPYVSVLAVGSGTFAGQPGSGWRIPLSFWARTHLGPRRRDAHIGDVGVAVGRKA